LLISNKQSIKLFKNFNAVAEERLNYMLKENRPKMQHTKVNRNHSITDNATTECGLTWAILAYWTDLLFWRVVTEPPVTEVLPMQTCGQLMQRDQTPTQRQTSVQPHAGQLP